MNVETHQLIQQHTHPLTPLPTHREAVLRPLTGIHAVLFDVYGTLLISGSGEVGTVAEDSEESAFRESLQAVGLQLPAEAHRPAERLKEAIRQSHANSQSNGIEFPEVDIVEIWKCTLVSLANDGLIDSTAAKNTDLKRLAFEYELRINPVWPMPHATQCLQKLDRAGLRLGIISNAQFFTPEILQSLLPAHSSCSPKLQFFSYQYENAKPGLFLFELARNALAELGITPAQTLYVGNDMLNDIYPAHKIGFQTALFAGDARSYRSRMDDPRMKNLQADLIIADLSQIPQCLMPCNDSLG